MSEDTFMARRLAARKEKLKVQEASRAAGRARASSETVEITDVHRKTEEETLAEWDADPEAFYNWVKRLNRWALIRCATIMELTLDPKTFVDVLRQSRDLSQLLVEVAKHGNKARVEEND